MGTLSGLQEYQVYVYNCEKFNKSAEKAPLLEWQDLIDATVPGRLQHQGQANGGEAGHLSILQDYQINSLSCTE